MLCNAYLESCELTLRYLYSATHDAYDVVKTYTQSDNYTSEFDPYLPRLAQLNETSSSSTSGLKGFCQAWYAAASNPTFRQIQVAKADTVYYNPSQALADQLGLNLAISRGQLYDTAIQHGAGSDPDSLLSIAQRTPKTEGMSEENWIAAFMTERQKTLCNPSNRSTKKAWCASVARVKSYENILSTSQTNFTDSLSALDNGLNPVSIYCDPELWTRYIPGPYPKSGGLAAGAIAAIVICVCLFVAVAAFFGYRKWRYGTFRPVAKDTSVV